MANLGPAPWVNPKGSVGNFSTGKLTTSTNSHNVLNPTWFQSPYIYDGPNEWRGTSCNKLAANSIFAQYNGGKKKYYISNKHMNKKKTKQKKTKKYKRGGSGSSTLIPQGLLQGKIVNNTLVTSPPKGISAPTTSWWSGYDTPVQWGGYTWRNSAALNADDVGGRVSSPIVKKTKKRTSKANKKRKSKKNKKKKRKAKKGGNGYTMKTSVVTPKLSALANPIPIKVNNKCPP